MIKSIFYNKKILKNWNTVDEEALKQWVLKEDIDKSLDKDKDLISKAKAGIEDTLNGDKAKESDLLAYLVLRKKYKNIFRENNRQLENPTIEDVYIMDSLSLDEINDTVVDRKNSVFNKYFLAISEIFLTSKHGVLDKPISNGLYKSNTPTNDFIDNMPDLYNPMDDLGID